MQIKNRIALIATGDELTQGEIHNLDGQRIAQQLTDLGYRVGIHMITTDDEDDIVDAIKYCQTHYPIIIITGGLGPTVDDRTRYAVARVTGQPLVLDDDSWLAIQAIFSQAQNPIHESNKQQAYFPTGATIYQNPKGTAPGCKVIVGDSTLYVLPGPPRECMPMFEEKVLPDIVSHCLEASYYYFCWRLFGVGESTIGPQLEALIDDPCVETGYRVNSPYLDFKLRTPAEMDSSLLRKKIEKLIAPYTIVAPGEKASSNLKRWLQSHNTMVEIHDNATKGALAHRLLRPKTCKQLSFTDSTVNTDKQTLIIDITGIDPYWENQKPRGNISLTMTTTHAGKISSKDHSIKFSHRNIMDYVVEYLSHEILLILKALPE